jgi:hypothetical protein
VGKEEIDYLVELPFYDGWSVKVLQDGTKVNRWQRLLNERGDQIDARDRRILEARARRAQAWIEQNS